MIRAAAALVVLLAAPVAEAAPRVRIVGTVQDGGLPHVACRCDNCDTARQPDAVPRYVSSLALITGPDEASKVRLFDATPDLARQLDLLEDVRRAPNDRVDRSPLDGIFLTHAHMGHYTGLDLLGFEAVHARAVPVYGTASMLEYLRTNGPWSQLVRLENIVLRGLSEPVALEDGVSVRAVPVPHRDEYTDTVGFLIQGPERTVFFVPDTDSWDAWDPGIDAFLATHDVDLALLDATFYSMDELPGREVASIGHPLITHSMDRLQAWVDAGREVWFLHLNHSNPALRADSDAARTIEARGFRVAREGREYGL